MSIDRYHGLIGYSGLVYRIQRFAYRISGLVIDKSKAFQTIYPIRKYHQTINIGQIINKYQTIVSPNHVYQVHCMYPYRGYRGLLSKYRPTPGVSLYEMLNVSHNGQGGSGRGYIRNTKPFPLVYTNHTMEHIWHKGLMV